METMGLLPILIGIGIFVWLALDKRPARRLVYWLPESHPGQQIIKRYGMPVMALFFLLIGISILTAPLLHPPTRSTERLNPR